MNSTESNFNASSNFTKAYGDMNATVINCDHPYFNEKDLAVIQGTVYSIYAVIFVISMIGNGVVCYIVVSSPRMRTVTNFFIMNLAIGDIMITIFCVPFTAVSYVQQYWPFGAFTCPMVNYSQAMAVFVSAYTMMAISVDRYMAIMWPLKPRISKRLSASIILFIWFVAAITVLPILIVSTLSQPAEWYNVCDRYICQEVWDQFGEQIDYMYTKVLMVLQYIIPLSVLLFTYTSIAVVVWCHRIPGEAENCRDQRIASSKRKMVKMMVIVVFVYNLCWLPFNVFLVWLRGIVSEELIPYMFFTFHILAMSHACYNPVIYFFMNTRFRTGFLAVLAGIPCCRWCVSAAVAQRSRSSTGLQLTSVEGTESTLLHRSNTSTTYISMRRKNGSRITSTYNNQVPVRSASMMRNTNNHIVRRVPYPTHLLENSM